MKMLFIPLYKKYFLKFKAGEQDCEIRPLNHRGWTSENVYPGRIMTLSNGYGKHGRLEKEIVKIIKTRNLQCAEVPEWHIKAVEGIYGKRDTWLIAYV